MECEKCPIQKECHNVHEALPKIGFASLVKQKCPMINMVLLYPLRGIADLCETQGNPKKGEKLRKVISEYET
jgi:hypothetical protein